MEYKINTQFDHDKGQPTPSGSPFLNKYIETVDKNGKRYLKQNGKENIYEKIQASLSETQIYNILERYKQTGDESLLNRRKTIYGDFTNIPSSPAEMQNVLMQADAAFNSLDKEVREAFENDVGMFKQAVLDGSFENKLSNFIKKEKVNNEQKETTTEQKENTINE